MSYIVEFFEISETRSLLTEIRDQLTPLQMAQFHRQIKRLEEHGRGLGLTYFNRVRMSRLGLSEYRLTLDRVEFRVLFFERPAGTFYMLTAYKERRNSIPPEEIARAERRWHTWKNRSEDED